MINKTLSNKMDILTIMLELLKTNDHMDERGEWNKVIDLNLTSTLREQKKCYKKMLRSKGENYKYYLSRDILKICPIMLHRK